MPLFNKLKKYLSPSRKKELEPALAYDQWSAGYDSQPGNLMLVLDEQIFTKLLSETTMFGKIIADVGCGTGRHWAKIIDKRPAKLVGYDVSAGMLATLQKKFPQAETHLLTDVKLPDLGDETCDLVISTLTVAHIDSIEEALREWRRVLKPEGEILITDYHPDALSRGAQRTFRYHEKTVAVRNHIHTLSKLMELALKLDLQVIQCIENKIDDSVRPYYEQ